MQGRSALRPYGGSLREQALARHGRALHQRPHLQPDDLLRHLAEAGPAGQDLEEWALKNMPAIPLGRIGYPADVAKVITSLASDDGDYMTGQAINITGGQEMH